MKIIYGILLILGTSQLAIAASYKLDVKDNKPFYQTGIPLEIYNQTHSSNLEDLTISNAAGEQIPYALVPYEELHSETTKRTETIPLLFSPVKISALQNPANLRLELEKSVVATTINVTAYEVKPSASTVFLIDLGTKYPPINELLIDWQDGENTFHHMQVLSSATLKTG